MTAMLKHRWTDCVTYADGDEIRLERAYGLLDNARLQDDLLEQSDRNGVRWRQQAARTVTHHATHSTVTLADGSTATARKLSSMPATRRSSCSVQRMVKSPTYQGELGLCEVDADT